jgi:hypothetical protein
MELSLSIRRIAALLFTLVALLAGAHLLTVALRFYIGHDYALGFVPAFVMDSEGNVPAFFSSLLLLTSALLCFYIYRTHEPGRFRRHWLLLGMVFVFLSADELVRLHEKLIYPMSLVLDTTIDLYYIWAIPYGIAALCFAAAYLPFLRHLPRRAGALMVLAGALYVSGAIGMEIVGGTYFYNNGVRDVPHELAVTAEESLEMLGVCVFILSLLSYISARSGGLFIRVTSGAAASASRGAQQAVSLSRRPAAS